MTKIITILDQEKGRLLIREIPKNIEDRDPEEILEIICNINGSRASNCSYMITEDLPFYDFQ